MKTIDINCDLAEGGSFDTQLMPLITSCSIACGGHYGTIDSMTEAVKLAKTYNVKIGAHPSYPDKTNFGRESMQMSSKDLKESLKSQITTLKKIADTHNYPITHIKPHGALYNDANSNPEIAKVILEILEELQLEMPLFVAPNSEISKLSTGIIDIIKEGFCDRNYNEDYTLVSRKFSNAVIENTHDVVSHVMQMVTKNRVGVGKDVYIPIAVETICMHSDTHNAVEHLVVLREKLIAQNIQITAYGS